MYMYDDGNARAPLAMRSRPRVRSNTATRMGEHTSDRQLELVAGELPDLGCSEAGRSLILERLISALVVRPKG